MNSQANDVLRSDDFSIFVADAFEIFEKSGSSEEPGSASRRIGGWCSTEELDRQGEIVVAKGLDFSEFVKWGWFNDNHRQDTDSALGFPTEARLEKGRWWTEGYLIPDYPPADRIWQLAKSLAKMNAPRRLGFSIEGKVVERDGSNKILRAKIRDVAVTRVPVNPSCSWTTLSKAFAPAEAVEEAAEKALAASHATPAITPQAVLTKQDLEAKTFFADQDEEFSFASAFDLVRRRWPHLTLKAACRVARHAMQR